MRVALYARVSTDEQALHGLSIEAQLAALDDWAKEHTVVDHYIDPGISGRKPYTKRPDMMRLLSDVEHGKIDLVVFCKLDRWFRSVKEYYKVQDILDRHHVAWRAIQEDYETETATGRFKVNIMLSVAQDEAERTSERVKVVFDRKRERGESLGGKLALGIDRIDGKLVPSADAPIVRGIFSAYIQTRSIWQTAQQSEEIAGKRLTYNHVQKILGNRKYRELGIIPEKTFDEVQEMRKERAPRRTGPDTVYIFGGLLFCSVCGRRLSSHKRQTGGPYYYCRSNRADARCTNTRTVNENKIEKYLLANIVEKCEEVNLVVRQAEKKKVDVQAIKRKMDKLTDLYLNDLITREKYERDFKELQNVVKQQETQRTPVSAQELTTLMDAYKTLSREAKKAFWNTVLERITVSPSGSIDFSLRIISSPREWFDTIQ